MERTRAFTLIELLVVIAIIGVLSSVVLASLNTARAKARDAKRVSDLHEIQLALEMYYNEHDAYPAQSSDTTVANSLGSLVPQNIPALPTDPTYTGSSGYRYTQSAGYYTLLAHLERTGQWCHITNGGNVSGWNAAYPAC